MQLPGDVRGFVDEYAGQVPSSNLARAVAAMSEHYRGHRPTAALLLPAREKVAAYLVTRLPATYAAAFAVLSQVRHCPVTSLLDLGAGPGAATLAARQIFSLSQCTLIESDPDFVEVARQLLPEAELLPRDLRRFDEYPAHDLVVANCALSELSDADRSAVVDRAWRAARVALVILEPGSPAGFALIRTLRDRLLGQGAHMIAPCPAEGPCPMVAPDWCHFGQRVERTSLHRRMKRAELGYEDEKFSYVALAKAEVPRAAARILRRPEQRPGMIELVLCHGDQIRKERVTRRTPDAFRAARHALWGGEW